MKKLQVSACLLLAVLSIVASFVYFTKTAGSLPHYLPGYTQGLDHKHLKHGVVLAGLAVTFLLGAWMLSGKQSDYVEPEKHIEK